MIENKRWAVYTAPIVIAAEGPVEHCFNPWLFEPDESLTVTCRFSVCHCLDAIIKMSVKSAVRHEILVARR